MEAFKYGCIVDGENFCDRPNLSRQLANYISSGQNVVIQGERRIGKSSLVRAAISGMSATVWGQNIRDEEIQRLTKIDPHALGKWRVNGTMPQLDTWYEAFTITENDPMYIAPEKRVNVW